MRRLLPILALGAALAGCGAAGEDSTTAFSGEQQRVAQTIEDLQKAGAANDAAEICSRLFAKDLVDRLAARPKSCTDEVEHAVGDADEFELKVEKVQIAGATATAQVRDGQDRVQSLRLVKESGDWKVAALPAA